MSTTAFAIERRGLELLFRRTTLTDRTWLNDRYVRLRLSGADLAGFDSPGADDHIRVFFPDGDVQGVEELRESPSREYTPLAWGEDWLDIEFVLHGPAGEEGSGIAASWAATAPLGAVAGVGGPRGSAVITGAPDGWFLAGDETAVPAIRRFAQGMDTSAVGQILVEVADADHELPIEAPSGIPVEQVHRGSSPAGTALAARLDSLTERDRPAGEVFGFVAAEQSIVRPGRALLLDRWGLDPERITVKGYWKRNETEYHAPH